MVAKRTAVLTTSYKEKLPRGWSYPAGAAWLSELFADVSQIAVLKLHFRWRDRFFLSDYQAALSAGEPITVLRAMFSKMDPGFSGSNQMIESGWYNEQWELTVFAVPSEARAAAHAAIERNAYRVREWVAAPRSATWRHGRHAISLRVLLPDCEVSVAEDSAT